MLARRMSSPLEAVTVCYAFCLFCFLWSVVLDHPPLLAATVLFAQPLIHFCFVLLFPFSFVACPFSVFPFQIPILKCSNGFV